MRGWRRALQVGIESHWLNVAGENRPGWLNVAGDPHADHFLGMEEVRELDSPQVYPGRSEKGEEALFLCTSNAARRTHKAGVSEA
jgi:hypothetical protein